MNGFSFLQEIVNNSKYIKLDEYKIYAFTESVSNCFSIDSNYTFKTSLSEKESILFFFLFESMNFCFWKNRNWIKQYKGIEFNGSEALLYLLLDIVEKNKEFLNIDHLMKIKKEDFYKMMNLNGEYPDLLEERFNLFHQTVEFISQKGTNFFNELYSIKSDKILLSYIVDNIKHFQDIGEIDGVKIAFNKRANLLVRDLFNCSKTIRKNIGHINCLNGGADYALPRIFRDAGIMVYNSDLSKIVDSRNELLHNSRMEIEIRVNTLYVLEYMKKIISKKYHINFSSLELDNIIWRMRNTYNLKTQVHRTRTVCY